MGLSPKELGEALRRQMREKTGRTVDEWVEVLAANPQGSLTANIAWLKQRHGLGHYQAELVAEQLEGVAPYADDEALVTALFEGKSATCRETFEALARRVMALGGDVAMKPCRTYVPFCRRAQFVVAKPGRGGLVVGLALSRDIAHPRLAPAKGLGGSERINFKLTLSSPNEIDDEVLSLLRVAYEANG
jgi:predicted transport protein